jgi:hypothetical protein
LPIKRATRKTLKAFSCNAFKVFLGLDLSAKRCSNKFFLIFGLFLAFGLLFYPAICGVIRTPQMAKNGKNRLAILTIFRFRRTDVK